MYAPPAFRWEDETAALQCAAEWNFGVLITAAGAGAPFVSHLPFLVDAERRVLRAHLARANPHAGCIEGGEHLAVFTGPHAYISPDWYGEGENDVPTWNYLAVHAAGKGRVLTDDAVVDAFLADLSAAEEARRHDLAQGGKIWTMGKLPSRALARMRAAIVAFEIDIETVAAKAKLSQNKPAAAAVGVAAALAASDSQAGQAVSRLMTAARKADKTTP